MDDYRGRFGVIVALGALVVGGALVLLRALGIANTLLAALGGGAIVIGLFFLIAYLAHIHAGATDSSAQIEAVAPETAEPPAPPSLEEVGELAARCARASKAIYAFLNKHATRTDEAKIVAEYRQKFDAKVMNVCLDLIASGLSTTEGQRNALKPVESVDDIQWIARILAISGESYSARRLARAQSLAMGELTREKIPHKLSCPARPHVVAITTERPDGTEIETMHCQECGAETHRLLMPAELVSFLDVYRKSGGGPPLPTLERWMDQESVPKSQRARLRQQTEVWFKALDEDGPWTSSWGDNAS